MKAHSLLKKVQRDYTRIARSFDATRGAPWPEFGPLFAYVKKQNLSPIRLLDVGCGNGRLLDFMKGGNISYTGVDNSRALLALARKKYKNARSKKIFHYGDMLRLPFPAHSFETAWCIAALHHLPTAALQKKALKEMKRILTKNGILALTVWNLWQPRYKKYIDPRTHDALIPWKAGGKASRYYYAFTRAEIKKLLTECGFQKIRAVPSVHNIAFLCHEKS